MRLHRLMAGALAVATAVVLTACGGSEESEDSSSTGGSGAFPVTIKHALGTTTIKSKPTRVATVNWENQEVPLALGVVPVGMAKANFGDDDKDGHLPWVKSKLDELGGDTEPVLFDETDGIDFEAVADTKPDVILAAYSGLTKQDYETLSKIAPTVAYPEAPWATAWRDTIKLESQALGLSDEGDKMIADIEKQIKTTVGKHPALAGKSAMFITHIDPADLSKITFYTANDTRVQFFTDLGLEHSAAVTKASEGSKEFSGSLSAEQIQQLNDVDIMVSYGDADNKLLGQLQADPLLGKIPAIKRGSVVFFAGSTPLATAANPTPLSISYVLNDYVEMLAAAAAKVK
ncbi:iron-siderophore ABC transporter substrate-binding protein [Cryptosporangium minutisporangium]|uniref:Iron-siderophore ABC transporter substrate-binding protein n=1 Tax=Cryptosporangium minutisporangium TaxID=113569 RepID=A0ABP6SQ47_9ACTN